MLRILRRIIYGIRGRSVVVAARWRITLPVRDSHKATVQSAKIEISLEKKLQKEKKIKENKNQMHLAVKEYDLVGILVGSWHSVRTDWSL